MSEFVLDQQLAEDSFFIEELRLCEVRLFNNANFPWFLLIPKRQKVSEVFDLPPADRAALFNEISDFAARLKQCTGCDKINIATIGNIVSQLHIHIVARFGHDAAWPKPVWGSKGIPYVDRHHAVRYWQEKLVQNIV